MIIFYILLSQKIDMSSAALLNQDFGSESEDDNFNPAPAEDSDNDAAGDSDDDINLNPNDYRRPSRPQADEDEDDDAEGSPVNGQRSDGEASRISADEEGVGTKKDGIIRPNATGNGHNDEDEDEDDEEEEDEEEAISVGLGIPFYFGIQLITSPGSATEASTSRPPKPIPGCRSRG